MTLLRKKFAYFVLGILVLSVALSSYKVQKKFSTSSSPLVETKRVENTKERGTVDSDGVISATSTARVKIADKKYTVKQDESLWDIAEKRYGDGNMWVRIAQENHLSNADSIEAGMQLNLP